MGILRLSHVDVRVPDLDLASAYYTEVMGLLEVERTATEIFLKCWDETDHHSVKLSYAPRVGLDLISFKVEADEDLATLESRVERYGLPVRRVSRGESVGQGESIRFETPSGQMMELVREVERVGGLHHFAFWLDDWDHVRKAADILAYNGVQIDVGPTRHGITRGNTIYFFDPLGTRNEVFTGGYRPDPDFPTITWTEDNIGRAIFYYEGDLNERFMKVHT